MIDDRAKTMEVPAIVDAAAGDSGDTEPPTERFPSVVPDGYADALTEKALAVATPSARDRATLTVIAGVNAGQVFTLEQPELTVGRGVEAGVMLDDPALSRMHARFGCGDDGLHFVVDLESTNGTFHAGRRVERAVLASGDRVQLGPHVILRFAITDEAEATLQRQLYESSTRDGLTVIYNRKYFVERLKSELAYAQRHRTSLAVLMLDVDRFKQINDSHGHLAGDAVLRAIADRVSRAVRREDVFARYGGEEFAVLARSGTAVDAVCLAERLRSAIEQLRVEAASAQITVTVSIGVGCLDELAPGAGDGELIALADTRLYRAKGAGRNRVCSE